MAHFAKVVNDKVVDVIVASQEFIDKYDDGLNDGGEWIQTSYNSNGGKHFNGETGLEDDQPHLRYNYAGMGFAYHREKDAFIPPKPYESFVLNETTMRWEPPIPYPQGLDGGPRRFIWDEEHYQEYGTWKDLWLNELSYHNPESKYYDKSIPKYGDADYPFNDLPQKW